MSNTQQDFTADFELSIKSLDGATELAQSHQFKGYTREQSVEIDRALRVLKDAYGRLKLLGNQVAALSKVQQELNLEKEKLSNKLAELTAKPA